MADTGYNWGSWAATQLASSDWTAIELAEQTAPDISDAISLDGYAAIEVSVTMTETEAAALTGDCLIYVLGDADGTNYEEALDGAFIGNPFYFAATPIVSDTVRVRFRILASQFSSIKIGFYNDAGQPLDITVKHKFATIPVAA